MGQMGEYRACRARSTDWAVLYLRLFLGGVILLYNIGNIQDYNEIIDSYPSLLFLGNTVSFGVVTVVEVVAALLLMIGFRVRFAAVAVALGLLVALVYALPAEVCCSFCSVRHWLWWSPEAVISLWTGCGCPIPPKERTNRPQK